VSANDVPEINVPSIGAITSSTADIVSALGAVKETIEVREGIRGPSPYYDKFIRYRDLIEYIRTDAETVASISSATRWFDSDDSHYLSPTWNEDDTADRILNFKVNGADRTIDLSENLTIADGYDVTITAEDAAASIVMDNVNFEVENLNATQRNIKITSSKAGNTTLTFQEDLTILDGQDIELHASGGEKAQLALDTQNAERTLDMTGNLTVEANSIINQDLSSDSTTAALANLALTSVADAAADVDKFLVLDGGNNIDYRTGAELLADLSGDAAAAFSINLQRITNLAEATEPLDAVSLETVQNMIGVVLTYWMMPTSSLSHTLVISPATGTELIVGTPQTLTSADTFFKSSVADTPAPFVLKDGAIILVHMEAEVASVTGTKPTTLHAELYYMDADGTSNQVQIGADTQETGVLTETKTLYELHLHVAVETIVPAGKRLWLKFVATTTGATNNPTVWIYNGDVHNHIGLPLSGSVLGNYVTKALFDAHTVLYATVDDIPAALTVTEQTLVGRLTGGNISAVAIGIADNNMLQVDGSPNSGEYAKFTANGIEGKTFAEMLTDLSATWDGRYYTETEVNTWRSSVTQTEMSYLDGVTSDIQTQLDARCLESVLGTSIGAGLLLDGAVLKASAILQKYHGIDPSANIQSLLGAANYAAMLALLTAQAGAAFSFNSQNLTAVGTIDLVGGQIAFPSTPVPSADPNTLDDYEEGTYGGSGANGILVAATGSITCSNYQCTYVKIGRLVFCGGNVIVGSVSSPSGETRLVLPFTVAGGSQFTLAGVVNVSGIDFTADYLTLKADQASATALIIEVVDNSAESVLPASGISAGDAVTFGVVFFV